MPAPSALQRGDTVPHWHLMTVDGRSVSYASVWQRLNLVLVALPARVEATSYVSALGACCTEFNTRHTECIVTGDEVPGLPGPGVLVADKWGEIVQVWVGSTVDDLPSPRELLDWIEFIERRCPECEGEAK
jgi:hypothetical protein